MADIKTTHTASARGSDSLTVAQLAEVLSKLPPEAYFTHLEIGDSQRDGSWWAVDVSWQS